MFNPEHRVENALDLAINYQAAGRGLQDVLADGQWHRIEDLAMSVPAKLAEQHHNLGAAGYTAQTDILRWGRWSLAWELTRWFERQGLVESKTDDKVQAMFRLFRKGEDTPQAGNKDTNKTEQHPTGKKRQDKKPTRRSPRSPPAKRWEGRLPRRKTSPSLLTRILRSSLGIDKACRRMQTGTQGSIVGFRTSCPGRRQP